MSHTPGPWRWSGNYLLQDCPSKYGEGKEENPYSTPVGRPIADDGSAGDEYSATIDIHGPDARLIAAAPELLDALEFFVEQHCALVDSGDCGNWDPETDPVVIRARAAIAKAKGKA